MSIQLALRTQKIQIVSIFCLQISSPVLWKQMFLKEVFLIFIKWCLLKLHFIRERSKTKYYRGNRKFDTDYFSFELSCELDSIFCPIKKFEDCEESNKFSRFHRVFLNLLNIQAPLKKEIFRGNNSPVMTKTLRKAILLKSRLKSRFNKTRPEENWLLYKT